MFEETQKNINEILAKEENPLKRIIRNIMIRILRPFIQAYDDKQDQLYEEIIKQVTNIQKDVQNEKSNQDTALQNLNNRLAWIDEKNNNLNQQTKMILDDQINRIDSSLAGLQQMNLSLINQLDEVRDKSEKDEKGIGDLVRRLDKTQNDMGAVARQVMLAKWKIIDHLIERTEQPDDLLTCKICGETHKRKEYKTKETDCIFNGGHLVRYVCPRCGAIFGPSKFVDQGQKGIDEDYWVHYLGFSEGDSTGKEMRAFHMLKPKKDKVYLNYGCGGWSHSLQTLREKGYNVYGYEPYAANIDNPYIFTDKEQLSKIRFDGIYSNDVIEHLIDPVEELKFMGSLLLADEGKMSHSTTCYIYKNEYTRFHTFFFVKNSIQILAERAGLNIISVCDDMEQNDFICYVYRPKSEFNLINKMFVAHHAVINSDGAYLDKEGMIYGPYLILLPRQYCVCIELENQRNINCRMILTTDLGTEILQEYELRSKVNMIEFEFSNIQKNVEFVICNYGDERISVKRIWLK